ncbi:MAG: YbhB/YbcL family Raf kinase inhibitor-like protein [Proteobacteria bacterium]|nr:YbhB/YbcL family Raf kinase inhibitor-like protein [Pseudomonadota bacterium]
MKILSCFGVLGLVVVAPAFAGMQISSADLKPGASIPAAHIYPRCGGQNISPDLSWSGAPAGTKSFVVTMIDVSVKPAHWSHWVVVDLPPDTVSLARGIKTLPGKAHAIPSNFGDPYYDGPCPPEGSGLHEYQITIWALGTGSIEIAADTPATELERTLARTALDHASLTGSVKR